MSNDDLFSSTPDAPRPGQVVVPEHSRLLTHDELVKAAEWINERSTAKDDGCLVCGSTHSTVQPSFAPIPGGVSPWNPLQGWLYPSVVVICNNCGFTRLFNAVKMGLIGGGQAQEGDDA